MMQQMMKAMDWTSCTQTPRAPLALSFAWVSVGQAGVCEHCGMRMGPSMWIGMGLVVLVVIGLILALYTLAVFVVRHSRRGHRHAP